MIGNSIPKKLVLALWIVALASAVMFAIAYAAPNEHPTPPTPRPSNTPQPTEADPRPYCHANSAGFYIYHNNSAWVAHLENNGTPKAGHELDFFTFEGDTDCVGFPPTATPVTPSATPVPSNTPTATPVPNTPTVSVSPTDVPTEVPTDEPTATQVPPTEEPTATWVAPDTGVPTEVVDPSATFAATDEPTTTLVATETPVEATPTPQSTEEPQSTPTLTGAAPTVTPTKKCHQDPCGWLWHLVGPDGQTAWFASYSLRPGADPDQGPSWYPPSVESQLACLGWVQVGNLPGKPLSQKQAQLLTSCMGGQCQPVGR